ncbi:MAG: M15 family metallopeptidase [Tetrasphaera jenkinsii]|jgi:D-alanyl-D-alanine carboxypeptidase|nr:M15 family metallopeptidase [Tetrasphaera jenkinsii]
MTSQPLRTRPVPPPMTFGAPKRQRTTRRGQGLAALVGVPLLLCTGLGAVVINGYHDALTARSAADRPADAAAGTTAAGAQPDAPNTHAPTGPDVGMAGLNPALTRAMTRAREAATVDGVTINIVSGHRSPAAQQILFDQAIAKYGSPEAASQWVLPPDKSEHVTGGAVDVGPYAAAKWLSANGVKFGLCQRYANEYWHFEVLAPATGQKCPALEANAASGG